MSAANQAVFLSYASQDAEAAQRLADALRAAGIEVWFDQNELRGGDAWDQKIRDQVRGCVLFVPIISANTQARAEGYFRREWRMAVERMYDMADDQPFLVPVVIDGTADAMARVPERFRERQWARLREGRADTAFVQRVRRLLDESFLLVEPGHAAKHRTRQTRLGRRRFGLAIATIALIVVVVGTWLLLRPADHVPVFVSPRQVSASAVLEDYPAIAPDGQTVAYESNENGKWDIWVSQPGAEASVNRTRDLGGNNRYPSWSPDGREIAFWSDRDGGGFYTMPAFGGTAQLIVRTFGGTAQSRSPAAWSADGSQLAVVRYRVEGDDVIPFLQRVDLATRQTTDSPLPGVQEARLDLAWSPDGLFLAYIDAAQQPAETAALVVLRLRDGETCAVTTAQNNVRNPVWLPDSRGLMFASNRSGPSDFWLIGMGGDGRPVGQAVQVTTAMDIRHASFTPDGKAMAYSKGRRVSNIWRVPILEDRLATWRDAEPITDDHAFIEFMSLSYDGKKLAFNSDRLGNQELWILPVGDKGPTRLTSHPAQDWDPAWSPDGKTMAFYSNRSGNRDIWVMPAAGGAARQLTSTPELEAGPRWSPDGREITFRSERDGNSDIWVVSADGKEERQITDDPAGDYVSLFSLDGGWIYYMSLRSGHPQIWRTPARGGEAQAVTEPGIGGLMCWSPDGSTLYIGAWAGTYGNIQAYSIAEGRSHPVTDFSGRRGDFAYQAVATDGKYLYFTWREDLGDIWVMEVSAR